MQIEVEPPRSKKTGTSMVRLGYWVSIAGLVVQAVSAVVLFTSMFLISELYTYLPPAVVEQWNMWNGLIHAPDFSGFTTIVLLLLAYTIAIIALSAAGTHWMRSQDISKIRFGSLIVVVSAVLSVTTIWGMVLGSSLMIVGSIAAFYGLRSLK